jgi:hypothetical protein
VGTVARRENMELGSRPGKMERAGEGRGGKVGGATTGRSSRNLPLSRPPLPQTLASSQEN